MARRLLVMACVCALGALGVTAPPAAASAKSGTAAVVAASAGQPANSFSLQLPKGAACDGDSQTGGYRVQSFMVPQGVDPGVLTFDASGPIPAGVGAKFRQPLYDTSTVPYVNAATDAASTPGGPGTIIDIPPFLLDVFHGDDARAEDYTVGIACTKGGASSTQLDRYWSATVTVGMDQKVPVVELPKTTAAVSAKAAASESDAAAHAPASRHKSTKKSVKRHASRTRANDEPSFAIALPGTQSFAWGHRPHGIALVYGLLVLLVFCRIVGLLVSHRSSREPLRPSE